MNQLEPRSLQRNPVADTNPPKRRPRRQTNFEPTIELLVQSSSYLSQNASRVSPWCSSNPRFVCVRLRRNGVPGSYSAFRRSDASLGERVSRTGSQFWETAISQASVCVSGNLRFFPHRSAEAFVRPVTYLETSAWSVTQRFVIMTASFMR